jgi:DNA helicase-2/ATP-dependent DNA helicase PcrA
VANCSTPSSRWWPSVDPLGTGLETGQDHCSKDVLGEIEWAKASLIAPADYPAHVIPDRRDCPVDPAHFVRIFDTL